MQSFDLTHVMRADSALVMLMALALEAALPQSWVWQRLPHPVAIFGNLVDHADRKLNRDSRSFGARMLRGALVTIGLTAIAFGAGVLLDSLFRSIPHGWIGEAAVIIVMLAQRSLFEHVQRVERRLAAGYLNSARVAVGKIVGRDVNVLDEHGVARAAIESLAENFSDAVVSPMFWYLVLGLPGLLAFKAISTMDSMIGHLTPRHAAFGRVAARLDDAANFIPARLSALLLAIAAFCVPGGRPIVAIRTALRDGHRHRSVNAGYPEAAAAGALGLALGGPRSYGGETVVAPWLNDGGASATVTDIRRALILYVVACLANAMVVAGVLYLTL
ncbi:MAG TPA: adenosylcobinamide-phosphate synthase CbiB [Alphaproteobacteria bacterium]|nr:adenosylcobinamide-phosphate synthase CbiB [Alphaproteobacteria bacterium]